MVSVSSPVPSGSTLKSALLFFVQRPEMETWPKTEGRLQDHNFYRRACPSLPWGLWAPQLPRLCAHFLNPCCPGAERARLKKKAQIFFCLRELIVRRGGADAVQLFFAQISADFPFWARQNCGSKICGPRLAGEVVIEHHYWSTSVVFAFPKHALVARKLQKTSEFSIDQELKSQPCARQTLFVSQQEVSNIYEKAGISYPMPAWSIRGSWGIASSSGMVTTL